jgi:hypothetical protein
MFLAGSLVSCVVATPSWESLVCCEQRPVAGEDGCVSCGTGVRAPVHTCVIDGVVSGRPIRAVYVGTQEGVSRPRRPSDDAPAGSAPATPAPESCTEMGRTLSRHSGVVGLHLRAGRSLTGKCQEVHARRIRFSRNSDFCVIQTVLDHLSYQAGELHTIEKFVEIREWHGSVEVKARWRGHESWEDT